MDLLLAGGIAAGVYWMYQKGKQLAGAGGRYGNFVTNTSDLAGYDPNWIGGTPTTAPTHVDSHDTQRPSCQKFDRDVSQLFENMGNADLDKDKTACFAQGGERYVDDTGNVSWPTDNLANEASSEQGQCFFWDGTQFWVKPPQAVVNASRRLCFAAGGHHFLKRDNQVTYFAPEVEYQTWNNPDYTLPSQYKGVPTTGPSYCEVLGKTDKFQEWSHSATAAAFDTDQNGCLKQNGADAYRFRREDGNFVYQNPWTGKLVLTKDDSSTYAGAKTVCKLHQFGNVYPLTDIKTYEDCHAVTSAYCAANPLLAGQECYTAWETA